MNSDLAQKKGCVDEKDEPSRGIKVREINPETNLIHVIKLCPKPRL